MSAYTTVTQMASDAISVHKLTFVGWRVRCLWFLLILRPHSVINNDTIVHGVNSWTDVTVLMGHCFLPWLYFSILDSTILYHGFTSLSLTLLPSTIPLFHSTSLHITAPWLYFILLHSTWLYITLPWLYYTQFDSKLLFTLFHSTGFYHGSTSLYLTLPLLYITLPLF